jgi:hypothetical protein
VSLQRGRTLAEIAEAHRKTNDAQAARLGIQAPQRSVSIGSLPSTLKALNDARESAQQAIPVPPASQPRIMRTAFGEEQEMMRLEILKSCDHVRAVSGVTSTVGIFASAVKEYLTALGAPNGSGKDETLRKMREAVMRMSALQDQETAARVRGHR